MGKFAGSVLVVFGILLVMMAAGIFFGMIADNTLMIIAGPILILDFMILGAGIFLIYKGYKWISAANNNTTVNEPITYYDTNGDKRSPI